jgi:hypothetical protein
MTFDPTSIRSFRYEGFDLDVVAGTLICRYALDDVRFAEQIAFPDGSMPRDDAPRRLAVERAARLVFLLAGVSYYKAAAPPEIDLGAIVLTAAEMRLLRSLYIDGLGEYAYRNGLDLTGIRFNGTCDAPPEPVTWPRAAGRPLVPFGGGIDSIVTTELVRSRAADPALFVVSRAGDRFEAIERAAAVTGLPIVRAERALDPQILASRSLGFRNGHVPVTGILSAVAVMAAAIDGRDAIVMSNEWSASQGNVEVDGRVVNHQFSKSHTFEARFRDVLSDTFTGGPQYFSLLRPFSELRIAERFAQLTEYHHAFRSCNRAFHLDPAQRLDAWCGRCDKCCFIDLVLAPFLDTRELDTIFDGREPLRDRSLAPQFRTLLGLSADLKPFECVGDVDECRAAVLLAAARPDRHDTALLHDLARELEPVRERTLSRVDELLHPIGPHFIPTAYATDDLLV